MKAYKGTFTANTGTGNQTVNGIVDENGAAFTPKAVILWTSYATADVTFADGYTFGLGVTDSGLSGSASVAADDNVAAQQAACAVSTGMAVMNAPAAATATRVGAWVSFGSGEFVINWTTADGAAPIYHYLALGGDDLTADVVSYALATVRSATAASVVPSAWVAVAGASTAVSAIMQASLIGLKADGTYGQGVSQVYVDDNQNPSVCRRFQRDGRSIILGTVENSVNALGAEDAFGTAYSAASGTNSLTRKVLLLGGVLAASAAGLQPAATGNQAISGLGFRPKCVIIMSVAAAANAGTTPDNDANICIGACDRTRSGYALTVSTTAVTPSVSVKYSDAAGMLAAVTANATAGSSTIDAEAVLQSIDADGFTLNWTTADATAREYIWLALGDVPAAASGETAYPFVGAIA